MMANNKIIIIRKIVKKNKRDYSYWINNDDNTIRQRKLNENNPEGDIILKIEYKKRKNDRFVLNAKGDVVLEKQTKEEKEKSQQQTNPWNSKAWKKEREKILKNYDKCEWCWSKNKLIIHHTKYPEKFGDLAYTELKDKENIVIICQKCHYIVHTYMRKACGICHKFYHNIRWKECFNCFKEQLKNKTKLTKKDRFLLAKRKIEEKLILVQNNQKYKKEKRFSIIWEDKYSFGDYDYCTYTYIPTSLIPKWRKLYGKPHQIVKELN